jgi:hypothetical protein
MVLSDVAESVTIVENDLVKHADFKYDMLFVRGDGVILVSPL